MKGNLLLYGKIIPTDDDIDICVKYDQINYIENITNKNGYYFKWNHSKWPDIENFHRIYINNSAIDVFPLTYKIKRKEFPSLNEWEPIKKIKFYNYFINAPANYENYLNNVYGNDWKNIIKIYNHKNMSILKNDDDKRIFYIEKVEESRPSSAPKQ